MKTENQVKITIPKPCHEDWNKMTPNQQGAFCGKCCKTVIDFSKKSNDEIKNILSTQSNNKICGRFMSNQLDEKINEEPKIEIPLYLLPKNLSYTKRFIIALFLAFGTTLFSCSTDDDKLVGKVVVANSKHDSLNINGKMTDTTCQPEKHLLGTPFHNIPKPPVMGKPGVEKCTPVNGELKVEHTKGEIVMIADTTKKIIPNDTTKQYPIMGKMKMEKIQSEVK